MGFPTSAQPVLVGLIVVFGSYMTYEVFRWVTGNRAQLTRGQLRRRVTGGLLLELDLLLWLFADALMRGRPPAERLLYLLVSMLLVVVPLLLAIREAGFVARQYAVWRRELLRGGRSGEFPDNRRP